MESLSSLEEWAQSLVHRDWEFFWSHRDECTRLPCQQKQQQKEPPEVQLDNYLNNQTGEESFGKGVDDIETENRRECEGGESSEEHEDVDDWYDGHVEGINARKENGKYSFQVTFVGDEKLYTMVLEPESVRPSARAWIKRSKAILNSHQSQPLIYNQKVTKTQPLEWEQSLPPDTRTVYDSKDLAVLECQRKQGQNVEATESNNYGGPVVGLALHPQNGITQSLPEYEEVDQIRRLAVVLCGQVYLRTKLAPMAELAGGPSESYVDHLLECVKHLDFACRWYLECWDLHRIIFRSIPPSLDGISLSTGGIAIPTEEAFEKKEEDFAITQGLQEGRRVITNLLRIDTSLAGSKRKRQAETSPGSRKTKRRRRNKTLVEFIKESERGANAPSPDEDEFLSSATVNNFVDQVRRHDNRWYAQRFVNMLHSVSLNIVSPLLLWKQRVRIVLGDIPEACVGNVHSDGETSGEESDDEGEPVDNDPQVVGQVVLAPGRGKRFYTYDEIKSFEEAGSSDQVLRNFKLSRWQYRLQTKLLDVEEFEKRCWYLVAQVFSTPIQDVKVALKSNDNILFGLCQVRMTALSLTSTVNNVNPIGHSTSILSRKVLDDAITIRSWYLDLHRVESSKERLVFIDKMATRASELPRLPLCQYSSALDALFDEAVARLRNISQGYFDHLTKFNKYRSILLSRSPANTNEGIDVLSTNGVSGALQELGDIQVLSIAEEMLSVRLDVLRWKSDAQALLAKTNIPFQEVLSLKKAIDSILNGQSETRKKMIESIEVDDKVNAEIRSFAESDVTSICGHLVSLLNSRYSVTCAWKERADAVVSALRQHSGQDSLAQKPPAKMVDLKRILGLLEEYVQLGIYLPDDRAYLNDVQFTASKWSRELTDTVLDRTKPFSYLLDCLLSSRLDRPKGLLVDPARHVVDNLVDLLLWHQQALQAMKEVSTRPAYLLVAEGCHILEVFSKIGDVQFTVGHSVALDLASKELVSRRPMRVISCTKLALTTLGNTLLDRVVREDNNQGSPLLFLLHVVWQASVADFVQKYKNGMGSKNGMTLAAAQDLLSKRPVAVLSNDDLLSKRPVAALTDGDAVIFLTNLVSDGEKLESEALRLLALSKELFRCPLRHTDAINKHLAHVKDIHGRFRAPLTHIASGLALSKNLEEELDHHLKVLSWLVRSVLFSCLLI